MSKEILFLKDYNITDTGEVLVKHDALVEMFRSGSVVQGLTVLKDDDVEQYNKRHPESLIKVANVDDKSEMPSVPAYRFMLPERYLELDLDEYVAEKLIEKFPDPLEIYVDRVVIELAMMRERDMEDLVRTLVYMVETFEQNGVVHGAGRGSSCASLVLFLIGIHFVDPIGYDIPIEEFLR